MTDIEKTRRLLAAATPRPWVMDGDDRLNGPRGNSVVVTDSGYYTSNADLKLIEHLGNTVEELLDELERKDRHIKGLFETIANQTEELRRLNVKVWKSKQGSAGEDA